MSTGLHMLGGASLRSYNGGDLNSTVSGFINQTQSVDDVLRVIEETQQSASSPTVKCQIGVARSTVRNVLATRLREAAGDAIVSGKKRGPTRNQMDRLESSIAEAQRAGFLDAEVNVGEFEQLLRNLQVRSQAVGGSDGSKMSDISWLVHELERHCRPIPEERHLRLTDGTLHALCDALLRVLRDNSDACIQFSKLGGIGYVRTLFIRDGPTAENCNGSDHPELQMCLSLILAEVAFQAAQDVGRKREERKVAMAFANDCAKPFAEKRTKWLSVSTFSGDAQWAIETLVEALRGGVKRSEHTTIWAVIIAAGRLVGHQAGCQQLCICGVVPILRRARKFYASVDGRLPCPKPRPRETVVHTCKEPPAFVGVKTHTPDEVMSVKQRWLSLSQSLPELHPSRETRPSRASLNWLAGTLGDSEDFRGFADFNSTSRSAASLGRRSGPPAPLSMASPAGTNSLPALSHGSQLHDLCQGKLKDVEQVSSDYPSLTWLMGEDGQLSEPYNRVMGRSFVLLRLDNLLAHLQKTQAELAAPFTRQPV